MRNEIIIEKMIRYTNKIIRYSQGINYEEFCKNDMLVEACVFNLSQIGELTTKLEDDFKNKNDKISWKQIYGLRNRIVHDYEGVNLKLIWEIITEDLESLQKELTAIIS